MTNELFLIAAYVIIWGGLFGYVFFTAGQQHVLARQVQRLEERLAERGENNESF